ncbi:MAG TPA: tRNA preQ1(34) S-adenosylmethionine ribosyltransferase-isomerase QueA [Bacteriovoracaceae bacterium]|nr:tRNA preQ1(34) S-adenosylmethionine ribosyltransferase-isomerase QueA [Bacteriovoracaceae bacterium]
MTDLELESYDFHLPPHLIAERPVPDRHSSRLLVFDEESGEVTHSTFSELPQFLPEGSTLVFNRSKVFPCRLLGHKSSGGEAEIFLLSLTPREGIYPALIKASGKRRVGDEFSVGDLKVSLSSVGGDGTFGVRVNKTPEELAQSLESFGRIPIPPYIRGGQSDEHDKVAYQTVYAKEAGSVAAPTAGLHFSQELLDKLAAFGHPLATVTLHVGAGTFAPIKVSDISQHRMHEELFSIDEQNLKMIRASNYTVAVGTTTLRTLESSWAQDGLDFDPPGSVKSTSIFLHPGKSVRSIDALVTNFHLPKSSLLILVSALIGREKTLELYREAMNRNYRFFSYGDGMLIKRKLKRIP